MLYLEIFSRDFQNIEMRSRKLFFFGTEMRKYLDIEFIRDFQYRNEFFKTKNSRKNFSKFYYLEVRKNLEISNSHLVDEKFSKLTSIYYAFFLNSFENKSKRAQL